jgi:hypothetical protein
MFLIKKNKNKKRRKRKKTILFFFVLFGVFGLICRLCRFLCLHIDMYAIECKSIMLKRTLVADSTSIGAHAHSRHHHWRISAPALNPTYLALEHTSTSSTHNKHSSSVDFCQKFIFGPFVSF